MSELDDLPSWAGRSTEEVSLPASPPTETPVSEEPDAPEPPALPDDGQPEIAAPTEAAQAPPSPSELPPAEAPVEAPATTHLPETAEVAAPSPLAEQPEASPKRSRLRPLLLGLLGLGILAGAAAIGYSLASGDSDATEASGATETDGADDSASATAADGEGDAADADGATDTEDGGATTATDDADSAAGDDGSDTVTVEVDGEDDADDSATNADDADTDADAMNDGDRQAIFRDGKVYLTGAVPSEEIAAVIVAKAEAVVGPGNVINEYEIDPSTTIQPGESAPLFVEDVILFDFNSVEIADPFLPILDLGTLLLSQNPQATVTVVTRTDAVGSEEVNLEVAGRRADAVISYWVDQGVDPDQIIADPRGEEGASEDDDPETAARQRRAEFIITGLLD